MTQMAVISEEIRDTEENIVTISRVGHDGIGEVVKAAPIALLGTAASFFMALPGEFTIGIGALTFLSHTAIGTYYSMQKLAGDYIEMISPRRSLLTRKEQMKAWAFLPGKEINRTLETYYIKDTGDAFNHRLKNGLFFGLKRVPKSEATHQVTHTVKSSWRGAKIIQTIEPLEDYLWNNALEDTASLYEIAVPDVKDEIKALKGTTIAERIKAIETQT